MILVFTTIFVTLLTIRIEIHQDEVGLFFLRKHAMFQRPAMVKVEAHSFLLLTSYVLLIQARGTRARGLSLSFMSQSQRDQIIKQVTEALR